MKRVIKWIGILISAVLLISNLTASVFADTSSATVSINSDGSITFSHLDSLHNDVISYALIDGNGENVVVSLRKVNTARSLQSSSTWEVSYSGMTLDCSFYMTVNNNSVTSVYNKKINIKIGSYSNDQLSKTSEEGRLDFTYTFTMFSSACWLKGTVTGSDNDITVSYSM